jgi:hypothetical protein
MHPALASAQAGVESGASYAPVAPCRSDAGSLSGPGKFGLAFAQGIDIVGVDEVRWDLHAIVSKVRGSCKKDQCTSPSTCVCGELRGAGRHDDLGASAEPARARRRGGGRFRAGEDCAPLRLSGKHGACRRRRAAGDAGCDRQHAPHGSPPRRARVVRVRSSKTLSSSPAATEPSLDSTRSTTPSSPSWSMICWYFVLPTCCSIWPSTCWRMSCDRSKARMIMALLSRCEAPW